jgi:hypothetical protein
MTAKNHDVIYVAKRGFSEVGHLEASEVGLRSHRRLARLQVDNKEEGSQKVPLPDGEEDEDEGRDVVEEESC